MTDQTAPVSEAVPFKAEVRQLLDILIHSLYTEREIFLRELISNASDALHRLQYQKLTGAEVLDPDAELAIRLTADKDKRTLTISDTGVGMTREELMENLGTIAHSGAREFLKSLSEGRKAADIIGQFGVGFYSVFMVAEEVRVTARSWNPAAGAWTWICTGDDRYTLEPATKETRGVDIVIKLKEDAKEFAEEWRLEQIIHKHSDYVSFPIYLGGKIVNRQTPIWRQPRTEITDEAANDFYRQLTLDFEPPLLRVHLNTDSPMQIYALLFVPAKPEPGLFSLRKEHGLKLYSRKVLIQDYNKDLLPNYLRFMQGVVESEDLPLNVSREAVQSSRVIEKLRNALTHKVIETFKELAAKDPEKYAKFWKTYGSFIKEGLATDPPARERLKPLLRFATSQTAEGELISLAQYTGRMKPEQREIYYLLADDLQSAMRSPHLDYYRREKLEVLLLTDTLDSFMLAGLQNYEGFPLKNVASAEVEASPQASDKADADALPQAELDALLARFKAQLGERITDARASDRLVDSPLRLVAPADARDAEMDRVRRFLDKEYSVPKRIVEINPKHPLIKNLSARLQAGDSDALVADAIEQLYANGLLLEGLHPNPAEMVGRIQALMEAAVRR
ncbi:MAG: molecular chaperone HtpG [Anaerolineales bacterium]|nr:molecular chaperone HtpG [Anaerolineales bacterium]